MVVRYDLRGLAASQPIAMPYGVTLANCGKDQYANRMQALYRALSLFVCCLFSGVSMHELNLKALLDASYFFPQSSKCISICAIACACAPSFVSQCLLPSTPILRLHFKESGKNFVCLSIFFYPAKSILSFFCKKTAVRCLAAEIFMKVEKCGTCVIRIFASKLIKKKYTLVFCKETFLAKRVMEINPKVAALRAIKFSADAHSRFAWTSVVKSVAIEFPCSTVFKRCRSKELA